MADKDHKCKEQLILNILRDFHVVAKRPGRPSAYKELPRFFNVMRYNLQKGFKFNNGQVEIVDKDKLCFIVRNISKGTTGIRTISKALLDEYVEYFETKKESNCCICP